MPLKAGFREQYTLGLGVTGGGVWESPEAELNLKPCQAEGAALEVAAGGAELALPSMFLLLGKWAQGHCGP